MCGIFGGVAKHDFPAPERISEALACLAHRGPDASGIHCAPPVFLGHRRLSVIDVDSRSNQPMQVGPLVISYNGEIYNFRSIRNALVARGVQFETESDTEVIAQAFLLDGIDCVSALEGMFAFAIWDARSNTLTLARDKFGEKPLYYYQDGSHFCFASEIPPLERFVGPERLEVDAEAISRYFQLTYIPAPFAPYRNMRQLLPGTYLQFEAHTWQSSATVYYKPEATPKDLSEGEAAETLRKMLTDSVALRMTTSDVPVATFLSGGIDSSIVSALAAKAVPEGVQAYSIGFPNDPDFDESPYARLVAQHCPGLRHSVVDATEKDLLDFTDKTLGMLREPYADASIVPTAYLCAHVEEKVVLGGDAADELFAGYGVYSAMRKSASLPAWLKTLLMKIPAAGNPQSIRQPQLRAAALFHANIRQSATQEYLSWRSYGSANELAAIGLSAVQPLAYESEQWHFGGLSDLLAVDIGFNLPNDMLKKVDLASMQHGKEVRLPYLDSGLVEFALSLPEEMLINGGVRKHILRETFRDLLPEVIFTRRKQGFLLPIRKWLKGGELRDRLMDMARSSSELDLRGIERLAGEHSSGARDHSVLLWSILVYLTWRAKPLG